MKLNCKPLPAPRIEMLPLIDVVFLLLVFFIYAMLSMAVHRGMPVDLPESGSVELEANEAISISVVENEGGVLLFLEEEQVTFALMGERLNKRQTKSTNDKDNEVQIFADKKVSYQQLFKVLDLVKKAGLTRISLQAESGKTMP